MEKELTEELPDFKEILKKGMEELVKHERAFFDQKVDTVIKMLQEDAAKKSTMYTHKQVISLLTILKEKK